MCMTIVTKHTLKILQCMSHRNQPFFILFFFNLGFTPCKAEQPLQGMELQEKGAQKN